MPPTGRRRARERVLIVRLAGIGDVAVASTVLERLRAEMPDAEVSWLCGRAAEPLVRLFDGISNVVAVDEHALFRGSIAARARAILGTWRALRPLRIDRVLLLHVDRRYRVLVSPLLGARVSMLTRAKHGHMNPVPGRFLGDEYARLVSGDACEGPIERSYSMADLRSKIPRVARDRARRRVILVPGGARNALREDSLRRWPTHFYAKVASALVECGCEVALVGSNQDHWVRPDFEGVPVSDMLGAMTLPETLAYMRNSDLVVSHDTGPMHLARLVRTPLLALFGPTIPEQVLSIDETVTTLWGGAHLACRPCFDGREFAACTNNVCLGSVTPERVVEVARGILDRAGSSQEPVALR